MAKTTINNGDTGLVVRTAINNNFTEVYDAVSTGTVDNAVLRANGTGGTALQASGLIVEDAVVSFTTVTGDASTDIITVTGSTFANGQPVRFAAITGGSGLNATTNYFVRDVSGATFKVATTVSGAAVNFTTNITAGTLIVGHFVSASVALSENTPATNSDLVVAPKGTGAFIIGARPDGTTAGGNARGSNAVDLQTTRTAASQVASGPGSIIAGSTHSTSSGSNCAVIGSTASTATGVTCVTIGADNSSSNGFNSVALGGSYNNVNGYYAVALNQGGSATGSNSIACGNAGSADRRMMIAQGAGTFAANGDAQRAHFTLRNKTTTNSPVELFINGTTSLTRLTVPSGKVIGCLINIVGISSTGAAVAHYVRQYALKNVAGTTSQVYAPITVGTDNAAGTSISISADDANDALVIQATGTASTIWRWVASVDAVEIAYGV